MDIRFHISYNHINYWSFMLFGCTFLKFVLLQLSLSISCGSRSWHAYWRRSITFDTEDGIFEGTIMVYVHSTEHLTQLSNNLKKVPGVINVQRIDGDNKK